MKLKAVRPAEWVRFGGMAVVCILLSLMVSYAVWNTLKPVRVEYDVVNVLPRETGDIPSANCSLEYDASRDAVVYSVQGNDPQFYLRMDPAPVSVVRVEFAEPVSSGFRFQVYYPDGDGNLSEDNSAVGFVAESSREHRVSLPGNTVSMLRLDMDGSAVIAAVEAGTNRVIPVPYRVNWLLAVPAAVLLMSGMVLFLRWQRRAFERSFGREDPVVLSLGDLVLCLLLALVCSASSVFLHTGACELNLTVLLSAEVDFGAFVLLDYWVRCWFGMLPEKTGRFSERVFRGKGRVFLLAAVLMLFWLVPLVMLYPGTVINDTWGELNVYTWYMNAADKTGVLSAHHPILDTMILGRLLFSFAGWTGDWHTALFIFVMLQAVATSLVFAWAVDYCFRRLEIGPAACMLLLALYALLPVYPAAVQTVSKDAMAAPAFVAFAVLYMEIARKRENVPGKVLWALLPVSVLCALMKNVNTYVVLISLAALFVAARREWKRLLAVTAVYALVMFAGVPAVYGALKIQPGGKQEMFSLPFQQTARYVRDHREDVTEAEYVAIDRLLDFNTLGGRYDPLLADPVKGYTERGTTADYAEYVKVWFAQGLRHPETYLDATSDMLAGWFSSWEYKPLMSMAHHSQLDPGIVPADVTERKGNAAATSAAYEAFYDMLYRNPLTRPLVSYALYAALVPFFILSISLRKRPRKERCWVALMPVLLSLVLGCWLAPTAVYSEGQRYLYPVTYTMPLMLAWGMYMIRKAGNGRKAGDRADG